MNLQYICNYVTNKIFIPGTIVECMNPDCDLSEGGFLSKGNLYEIVQNYMPGTLLVKELNGKTIVNSSFYSTRFRKVNNET